MLTLQQLLSKLSHQITLSPSVLSALNPVAETSFNQLMVDSRKVGKNDVFVLLKSQNPSDSIDLDKIASYLGQVVDKAVFVLSEIDISAIQSQFDLPVIYLPTIRDFLGSLIQTSLQLQHSTQLPAVIAVTGTNGKTTVSQLVAQLISQTGITTAVMGTAGNGILPNLIPSTHTTLEVFNLQHAIDDFAKQGVQALAIEASSHGLHQQRLQGVPVNVAIFTNLSRDHLDYHTDMADYANAKAKLFDTAHFPSLTHAVINLDDEFSELMIATANASNLTVWTYSLTDATADFFAKTITPSLQGVDLTVATSKAVTPYGEIKVKSPLLGRFNVANLLASIAGVMALSDSSGMGLIMQQIQTAVPKLRGATGRMDRVPSATSCFIVDYAHTPDALEQVLTSLKSHCTGELWAVFGCGGDRDKGKRPLMAQAGLRLADKVILTADNPRSEDPNDILNDMQAGMTCEQHYQAIIEPNRQKAIEYAVEHAKADDIVVIAGKGHETYQEINGVRYDFDDKKIVAEVLVKFKK